MICILLSLTPRCRHKDVGVMETNVIYTSSRVRAISCGHNNCQASKTNALTFSDSQKLCELQKIVVNLPFLKL